MVLQRFLILSPELAITAAQPVISGTSVHRFSISSPDLRIDAAIRSKQGQSVHRFLISSPDFRIDVAPGLILGISLHLKGGLHCAAAGECRMGRDFGRRSRPWLREREGPAAQRWEGKHRRCAPVRSPCPQADSDAGTRSLPAGRFGRRAETISCGSAAR